MVIQFLKKYSYFFLAVLSILFFTGYYFQSNTSNYKSSVKRFERRFHDLEHLLELALNEQEDRVYEKEVDEQWKQLVANDDIYVHIYQGDSLVFWNTNQLPIIRYADIHFPSDGILHLQNGWYYAKTRQVDDYFISTSFLIKQDYAYENKELINDFHPELAIGFDADISVEEEKGYAIKDDRGYYVLSLVPNNDQHLSLVESLTLVVLLIVSIGLALFAAMRMRRRLRSVYGWFIPIVIVVLRILSIEMGWLGFMEENAAADPMLYGSSRWLPNFLEFLINACVIVYVLAELKIGLRRLKNGNLSKIIAWTALIGSVGIWILLLYLIQTLIEDSSIPLVIDELFSLNVFSILAVTSIGAIFYCYYLLVRATLQACQRMSVKPPRLAVLTFILGCAYLFYEINAGYRIFTVAIFPLVFYGFIFYLVYRQKNVLQLGAGLILLMIFSLVVAVTTAEFNERKERGERELYVNQLATEKDIVTEVEYLNLSEQIHQDKFLRKFIANPQTVSVSDFQEGMERRLFHGYWERYEMSFSLFDQDSQLMINDRNDDGKLFNELNGIIENAGIPSELDSNIYFISDYSGQYSYMIRMNLWDKDTVNQATLFCTLKSKKIPEEIGFPRLLISGDANALETLENYSIAKFHDNHLVTKYGDFNYPSAPTAMKPSWFKRSGFFDYGGYNHFMLNKRKGSAVVLSVRNRTTIDLITSFSYLFSFYGLILLPLLFRLNTGGRFTKTLSLAMKIQVVLISLVFLSLLAFGWGSGIFVSNQYNQYTDDVIREKLNSVQTEVRAKLGKYENLSISENGNYMQYILQKFAKVFFTDINLYDNNGYLLATSRPKVFNIGLLSEQMNPEAFKEMKLEQKSEFVHNESIGELNYASAYLPFYNNNGDQLGFINLQHFGQQREFESQIQQFLVAIINVFILLLAISIVLAIFISNWLTSPLRILQENFASVKFGKQNEQISYDREDEIGALVKDYNQKLLELEFAAQQLAKSERESAWREMAKQVAHEIKNPLTPMKLSVQQLLRTYNPDDPKSGEKLNKVANSIIEQIDALTKLTVEMSQGQKLGRGGPRPFSFLQLRGFECVTPLRSFQHSVGANQKFQRRPTAAHH